MDAQRNRYECKITSYPPTNGIMKLVDQVAIDLERLSIAFSSLNTSGIAQFRADGICTWIICVCICRNWILWL